MRIAVSSESNQGMESRVSPHFGRCPYFVLVDVEEREVLAVDAVENPFFGQHQPGQVPGYIKEQEAQVMLSGGMGRRAQGFFGEFGIRVVVGAPSNDAEEVVKQYLEGSLQAGENICDH